MRPKPLLVIVALSALSPVDVSAQPQADPFKTVIVLRPAAEPRPALKYRLVPERHSLVAGNAAVFYHRAIQFLIQMRANVAAQTNKRDPKTRPESIDEQVSRLGNVPLEALDRDEAGKALEPFDSTIREIELGALRTSCDWEFDLRKEGINMMLPEIQEMRSLARLVVLKARLAILEGKTDQAMHWIQVGLVMGRHVNQGPTMIQSLVGVAIDSVMTRCLIDLIQAPGTPSLFWALADRPRPFIDIRPALEGERYLLEKQLPELDELDQGPWSLEEARRFTSELERKLYRFFATSEPVPETLLASPDTLRRLGIAAMAAKIYPEAKRALLAEGRPEAEVEAMPVVQVAALHTLQEYRRIRDDSYKWIHVPYWQSYNRVNPATQDKDRDVAANPLLAMFRLLAPALNVYRLATLRLDRQLDAIQCVEAIRCYAAAHEGKLPASLDDLADNPAPIDPMMGRPFGYKVEGDTATLSAPVPPGAQNQLSYSITYILKFNK